MKIVMKSDHEFEIIEFQLVRIEGADEEEAEQIDSSEPNDNSIEKIVARVRVKTVVLIGIAQLVVVTCGVIFQGA